MLEFIIYGLIHEGDWDLTQPQATLLAGVISGVLLIAAAYIAFHGQREQRREEGSRHMELLKAQREQLAIQQTQFDDQLRVQREGWAADNKATSDRAYRDEVRTIYRSVLRSSRQVHLPTLHYHLAKLDKSPDAAADVEKYRAQIIHELEELMVLSEELIMVNSPEVKTAFSALVLQIKINANMLGATVLPDDAPREFDFLQAEELMTELAQSMGRHLDSLRPA